MRQILLTLRKQKISLQLMYRVIFPIASYKTNETLRQDQRVGIPDRKKNVLSTTALHETINNNCV